MVTLARIDWHKGKFNADSETQREFAGMEGWANSYGDWINYWHLNQAATTYDDVYDDMRRVPVLHATHVRGANTWNDKGFYTTDNLSAILSFQQYEQCGLVMADIDTNNYEFDRIVYDEKVFRIQEIAIRGKIVNRPIIITINATQLKPDELVEDQVFATMVESWQ